MLTKLIASFAVMTALVGGGATWKTVSPSAKDCCATGSTCCFPGSPCCADACTGCCGGDCDDCCGGGCGDCCGAEQSK